MRKPKATLSKIDIGNGVGFWKTMPMRARRTDMSAVGLRMSSPSRVMFPLAFCPG